MQDNDLAFKSITELARLLNKKEVTSVELTRYYLDRLGSLGPEYNALAELTPELALKQARHADRLLARGDNASPLLGIPYGAKDLLATKGIPTRWGAPPFRNQVFDYDATVIRNLTDAGAVLVGKLAMVELAGGGGYAHASASLHGPGLNPWDTGRWSGGSSSGSGSAVAAGLVPFALGSETWGSITTPSAYCGITGLRPTWGRVSRYGAMELAWSMDKLGPMARSAEDCGWILQGIAGYDPDDPTSMPGTFRFQRRMPRKGLELGVLPADFSGEPELERAFQDALQVLRKAGIKITRASLPDYRYEEVALTLLMGEEAAAMGKLIKSKRFNGLVDKHQKEGLRKAAKLSATEYVSTQKQRAQITVDVLALFDRFDALVSPSMMTEATPLDTNLQRHRSKKGNVSVLGALCGVPALTMPIGFGRHGLPLGITLTGDLFQENVLLQIGMLYQHETDWHKKRPLELS